MAKPLADEAITTISYVCKGASMFFYSAALPLSSQTLRYTAGIIRRHRRQIGSCWRRLGPAHQAMLVLAYLRKGETFAELAARFCVGTATVWRYVSETVGLLAARSPKLRPTGDRTSPRRKKTPTAPMPSYVPPANGQRPAQNLAHPAQTRLLPLESRATRQGHPRHSSPRDRRMKTLSREARRQVMNDCAIDEHRDN
jgi:Helix-turn-helix of DDE superfamily endonuclease